MLSTALFDSEGNVYNLQAVFGETFTVNSTALSIYGLPALTGSNAWNYLTQNLAVSALPNKNTVDKLIFLRSAECSCIVHCFGALRFLMPSRAISPKHIVTLITG